MQAAEKEEKKGEARWQIWKAVEDTWGVQDDRRASFPFHLTKFVVDTQEKCSEYFRTFLLFGPPRQSCGVPKECHSHNQRWKLSSVSPSRRNGPSVRTEDPDDRNDCCVRAWSPSIITTTRILEFEKGTLQFKSHKWWATKFSSSSSMLTFLPSSNLQILAHAKLEEKKRRWRLNHWQVSRSGDPKPRPGLTFSPRSRKGNSLSVLFFVGNFGAKHSECWRGKFC